MNEYFKKAGDLDVESKNIKSNSYFKKADDLIDNTIESDMTLDELNLSDIVSGVEYDFVSDRGVVISAGSVIVSKDELIKMIDDSSYNIIKATYLNDEMIHIDYQQFDNEMTKKNKL